MSARLRDACVSDWVKGLRGRSATQRSINTALLLNEVSEKRREI